MAGAHEALDESLAVLRASQDRALEQEGIPMVLALVSEIGAAPPAADERTRQQGASLAASMDRYRAALVPSSRDDDLGCLTSVLQAVSYADATAVRADERPDPAADGAVRGRP